jgi:hypothetical protein
MSVVVSIVNHLRFRRLKRKTFRAFLEEVDAEYSEVRSSLGRMTQRFVALKEGVAKVLKMSQ